MFDNDKQSNNILQLKQAYEDSWQNFRKSANDDNIPAWDYVFLTASNKHQACMFEKQLEDRKDTLPGKTRFIVVPDEADKRVGSGGATLSVLKRIRENEKSFENLKVLVIHSGGDSKRIPQYSAIGKLFSPVPHQLENGRSSTLFDELMAAVSIVPSRIREGMMLLSGDVLLLFNPLKNDFSGKGAAAISFKEDADTGKDHGVYVGDENGFVKSFLHKQSIASLRENGAINNKGQVDIDTGAVLFGSDILNSLFSLICTDGSFDQKKYDELVNEHVRLSLYGDFLYPLALGSSLDNFYSEKAEGEINDELLSARTKIWALLHQYKMRLFRSSPSKFIHFGTSIEYFRLMNEDIAAYQSLDWKQRVHSCMKNGSGYDSILRTKTDHDSFYLESSYIHENVKIGKNVIISNMEIFPEICIPDDVVIHGLKQTNGTYVCRIYGINDNPKEKKLFGVMIDEPLWSKELYPECESMREALVYALRLYKNTKSGDLSQIEVWKNKKSLCSGFADADPEAIFEWKEYLNQMILVNTIDMEICSKTPVSKMEVKLNHLSDIQKDWLYKEIEKSDYRRQMRLFYYFGSALNDETISLKAFQCLSDAILNNTLNSIKENKTLKIAHERCDISLPLRVNFGGGWSDTPPYCNENGGTVINAAILLNNDEPVKVSLERLEDYKIIFRSEDMDVYGEFTDITKLQDVGDPYDPFVLQKASLLASGIIPKEGGDLKEILHRMGGGFLMDTEVINVPKGSGLGTSSILAAACIKALFEFTGLAYNDNDLYSRVLTMEQLMSTGGGWQDQIGGVTKGIKFITSDPGINQKLSVKHLQIKEETLDELNDRFALIYTGQRRLARNLLRDVVGRYIGNEKDTVFALNEIRNLAEKMKESLEEGDIEHFSMLLSDHWELSKMIDEGSTNQLIDRIFEICDDLLAGKMVCGAGGGGFLQVVLKKGINKSQLRNRLKDSFPDSDIDIWDCKIV